ncbi:polysaccharide pyruvyl transferase family protein, partial [bacterium]|nr:polysaccharide pyruvyl transferase family protein [bacterium]
MKAMTIGISPYYNYPGTLEKWNTNNTEYASNHGGSLITRAIMKEFNADYVNDFSDIATLKNKYDTCIMALATHVHEARDVSMYVKLLKKLNMKVVIVSLGVSDYLNNNQLNIKIHSSIKALLNLAQESSNWIGVRGPYTAHILSKNGFKNVVPIGCPTVFWNMKPEIVINTKKEYNNPLVVYQENIAKDGFELIKQFNLLGQDFKDEVIFTDNLQNDISLRDFQRSFYQNLENPQEVLQYITSKGIFQKNFDEWFETIKKHDFIFGPRLHGVIASLIQGIPAVLTTRDLRTKELAEFFNIPSIEHGLLDNTQFNDIVMLANFQKFELTYQQRYKNYLS